MAQTIDGVLMLCFYTTVIGIFAIVYSSIMFIVRKVHSLFKKPEKSNGYDNSIRNYVLGGGKI
jgi:hypothetical protein